MDGEITTARPAGRRRRRAVRTPASPVTRTWRLSAGVAALTALAVVLLAPGSTPYTTQSWWVAAVVFAGFVISEPMVFHVEARNEAVSFSPSDLPLALGVLLLPLPLVLGVRLVAAAVALVHWRRPPLFKLVLNLAAFGIETVVAGAVFRFVAEQVPEVGPTLWLGLVAALTLGIVTGAVTIATAISFFEGDLQPRVRREITHSYVFYVPGALLGATAAVPYLIEPWLVMMSVVPVPLVWLLLRSHGSLMHRFVDLSQIHAFSSQVGRSAQLDDIAETAVREIAGHLRASAIALVVFSERGPMASAWLGNDRLLRVLPDRPNDPVWRTALQPGALTAVHAGADDAIATTLRDVGVEDALVVALGDDTDVFGVLVVGQRHGASVRFDDNDVERLRPLGQQLSVALRKGQLHVQIQHEALHDPLTGLPNRSYFDAYASQYLERPDDGGAAVLMIDLDRFKEVNDILGHQAGDLLLGIVAERLARAVREDDLVARLGGDEFAILLPDADAHEVRWIAERINDTLEQPIDLDGTTVAIAGSIGIALVPDHGSDVTTVMRRADLAMYDAKQRHERSTVFVEALESTDSVRLALLADLREALGAGTIDVVFQPQRDLRTDQIASVEALARWHHPVHGWVSPEVFVSLAEQSGLIGQLTDHVLDRALGAAAHWLESGHELAVAVNVSALSLVNETFPSVIAVALARAGVPAHLLTLEITERAMIGDSPRTIDVIEDLDRLGVRLSVDDFGTGYSSMVNLRNLPIAEMKIDRGFVTELLVGGNDEVIVGSTIDLGHNLGMTVVAEGVETAEVEAKLRAAGCDVAQGYGIARPLSLSDLDRFLETASTPRPGTTRPRLRAVGARLGGPREPAPGRSTAALTERVG